MIDDQGPTEDLRSISDRDWLVIRRVSITIILTLIVAYLFCVGAGVFENPFAISENALAVASSAGTATMATAAKRVKTLQKRPAKIFFISAGVVFFAMMACTATYVKRETCKDLALASIYGGGEVSMTACLGTFVVGSLFSAVSAGLVACVGENGWQWYKGSGVSKRNSLVYGDLIITNTTLIGGTDST